MVIQRCGVGAHAVTRGLQELHRGIRAGIVVINVYKRFFLFFYKKRVF